MNSAKQKIVDLLEQTIGLDVDTVSDSTFRQAIQHRMDTLDLADIQSYVRKLTASTDELRRLTEEVVIPETWFFRHKESFNIFINQMRQEKKHHRHFLFRVLSLPCSTGEEPYSVVMALLEAGIDLDHLYIKAVDISERALAIARRGVYGKNSFRSKDLSFRGRFFNQVDNEFVIKKSIRSKVHFTQGNITDSSFTQKLGSFDIIFCRNILIYFGSNRQQKVINDLYNLLTPEGTLFTGHAEASLFLNSKFFRAPYADSFAFLKKNPNRVLEKKYEPTTLNTEVKAPATTNRLPAGPRLRTKKTKPGIPDPAPLPSTQKDESSFETVLLMADAGKLEQAADACEKHLQESGPSSRWYYLLGVIRDSLGQQEEAVGLLRKALYLDPEHQESLFLLSLLAEQTGEYSKAVNYRKRAEKAQKREK